MNLYVARCALLAGLIFCTTASGQLVQFNHRAAKANDTAVQTIQCDLDAERTIRQHNQMVDTSKQRLQRNQQRLVTVLETLQGTAARARVKYVKSATRVITEKNQNIDARQPVEGNTYLVARRGEALFFATENGEPISDEEDKILRAQFETFGKPNPLANFLHGKRLAIGESLAVPDEVARELLGLTGNQGKTDRLVLKLTGVKSLAGVPCAVFETRLRSHSDESSLTLLMKGEIIIDPSTCRTHAIRLQGPVAISERRGPSLGRYTVSTNGTLQVTVNNDHRTDVASVNSKRAFRQR